MSEMWICYASEKFFKDVQVVLCSVSPDADARFAQDPDELRQWLEGSVPGTLNVLVCCKDAQVSDINLAAALAHDGYARRVVLARHHASGSLRSRAARAGIDEVIDPCELGLDDAPPDIDGDLWPGGAPVPWTFSTRDSRVPGAVVPTVRKSSPVMPRPLPPDDRAPVISFFSGRGGVGKTALAAAAAATAELWGMDVALLDMDLSCGNLYSQFGLPRGFDLAAYAREGAPEAAEAGVAVTERLRLFGPCESPEHAETVMPLTGPLVASLAARYDLVLIDTSTTLTDATAQIAQMADRLLLVGDTAPGAIASVARTSGLAVRLGVARTRIARVENKVNPRVQFDMALPRMEAGLEGARLFRVADGGDEVRELLGAGRALDVCKMNSSFSSAVAWMMAQQLSELGRLPDCEQAQEHLAQKEPWRRRSLFAWQREAS